MVWHTLLCRRGDSDRLHHDQRCRRRYTQIGGDLLAMPHRPKPKYASKDPAEGPWTTCDRCGFIWSGVNMAFQFDYVGGPVPQNLGLEVCPRCYDAANYQQKQLVLPPDPPPFGNTRPENYMVDETGPVQQLA